MTYCREQGIKIKVAKRVHVATNIVQGCNTVPELLGQLGDGINIQSSAESTVVGYTVIDDGTDGIHWDCKQTSVISPEGGHVWRCNHTLASNTVLNSAKDGIRMAQGVTDSAIR